MFYKLKEWGIIFLGWLFCRVVGAAMGLAGAWTRLKSLFNRSRQTQISVAPLWEGRSVVSSAGQQLSAPAVPKKMKKIEDVSARADLL